MGTTYATAHVVRSHPRRKWFIGGLVAFVVVVALVFGLVFGLNSGSSSGSSSGSIAAASGGAAPAPSGTDGAADCATLQAGAYWDYLVPDAYNLTLELSDPSLYLYTTSPPTTFNASASMALNVSRPTSCVVLQAAGMDFSSVSLVLPDPISTSGGSSGGGAGRRLAQAAESAAPAQQQLCGGGSAPACGGGVVAVVQPGARPVNSSQDQDLITIDLGGTTLQPGTRAVLTMAYSGTLGSPAGTANASGLHRSGPFASCADTSCTASVLMLTQMEPYSARTVLPCYDAPRFRASFGVTVHHPAGSTALSNTRGATAAAGQAGGPPGAGADVVTTRFAPTPRMPAYLLAVAVGQLAQYNASATPGGAAAAAPAPGAGIFGGQPSGANPEVRLWAAAGREDGLALAARVAPEAFK